MHFRGATAAAMLNKGYVCVENERGKMKNIRRAAEKKPEAECCEVRSESEAVEKIRRDSSSGRVETRTGTCPIR
jgi:hypothetical protein